jgi:hypothetical protein
MRGRDATINRVAAITLTNLISRIARITRIESQSRLALPQRPL